MAVLVGPPTHHNNAIPGFHRWQRGAGNAHSCMAEVDTLVKRRNTLEGMGMYHDLLIGYLYLIYIYII